MMSSTALSVHQLTPLRRFLRRTSSTPLLIIGVLWPLVLFGPFIPGIPKPQPSAYPWRQELLIAIFLSLTLALIVRRAWASDSQRFSINRSELLLLLPAALYTLWTLLSVGWAAHPSSALRAACAWGSYLLFFILMRRVAAQPRVLRASLFALGSTVCVLGLSSLINFLGAPTAIAGQTNSLFRFFSGFSEPMAVSVPLFAALALRARRPRQAALCGGAALLAWLATLQTVERAPIIGAFCGLLLVATGVILLKNCRPRSSRRALLLLAAFALATSLQVVSSSSLQGETSALARLQATGRNEPNTRIRILFWKIGLDMLRAHPLVGVGANNYEMAYPEARARYSAAHPEDPLVSQHEEMLVQHAHNEYVQIAAELGLVGLLLFALFGLSLVLAFWRALKDARHALVALGAGAGMLAFALSSGASAYSFRWMGSGLMFFFAAALLSRLAYPPAPKSSDEEHNAFARTVPVRFAPAGALLLALALFYNAGARGLNVALHGTALAAINHERAEQLYRAALSWDSTDPVTHYNYGLRLFHTRRAGEAVPHLRYSIAHGLNASVCYSNLAAAEAQAGDPAAAERTLLRAVSVYPRSVYLRVRHGFVLETLGQAAAAEKEYDVALSLDSKVARGWWQLMHYGVDAAGQAAREDKTIALPGSLYPENCILAELAAIEMRAPELAAKKKDYLPASLW